MSHGDFFTARILGHEAGVREGPQWTCNHPANPYVSGSVRLAAFLALVLAAPARAAGRVDELHVPSKEYARERRIWVATPTGYDAEKERAFDLVVAFDGEGYLEEIPLPKMLEELRSAGKAPPCVAVLVDDEARAARLDDLANHARFVRFLAGEVLPFVRGRYRVTNDPRRTLVTGSSAGGLAAAFVALERPDVFGNVLSQSGAFWRGAEGSNDAPWEWLTAQYEKTPKKDVRLLLEVGSTETRGALGGAAPSILEANRHLRDVLRKKGYAVTYAEVPGGVHSEETWKARLPAALEAIFSAR
jgi:enterochelin esterase family protein